MLKVYSKKKQGNYQLSANFKAKEFACKDGSDTIFIDDELVLILQHIRDHFKKPVHINSGYRNDAYNTKIKGAQYSQHMYGRAADIHIKGVKPVDIYNYIDKEYPDELGLGLYGTFVHVDSRLTKARWKE